MHLSHRFMLASMAARAGCAIVAVVGETTGSMTRFADVLGKDGFGTLRAEGAVYEIHDLDGAVASNNEARVRMTLLMNALATCEGHDLKVLMADSDGTILEGRDPMNVVRNDLDRSQLTRMWNGRTRMAERMVETNRRGMHDLMAVLKPLSAPIRT